MIGHVEVLDAFWNFEANNDFPDVVPPVLAYADLLATHDGRNAEAARMIYEQRIATALNCLTNQMKGGGTSPIQRASMVASQHHLSPA